MRKHAKNAEEPSKRIRERIFLVDKRTKIDEMYFFQFVRIRSRSLLVKIKREFVSMIILAADFVTATFQIQVNS